jgi:hypothetical protein
MCDEVVRLNIRVPEYIREWYKVQGDKYSVPYTNYISMLLTQIYERETEKELLKDFTNVLKDIKDATDSVDAEELLQQLQSIVSKNKT